MLLPYHRRICLITEGVVDQSDKLEICIEVRREMKHPFREDAKDTIKRYDLRCECELIEDREVSRNIQEHVSAMELVRPSARIDIQHRP